jgi:hypothetical protein
MLHEGAIDKKKRLVDMMIQKHCSSSSEYFTKSLAKMACWVNHLSKFWTVCTPLQKVHIMASILVTPSEQMSMIESLKEAMEKNGDGTIISTSQAQTFSAMCMFISSQSEQKDLIEAATRNIYASIHHQEQVIHWLCLYLDHMIILTEPLEHWFHVPFTLLTQGWPAFIQENFSKPVIKFQHLLS